MANKIWIAVIVLPACLGTVASMTLPETPEPLTEFSSSCYGTHTQFRPSCQSKPQTVMAVDNVYVGTKKNLIGCSQQVSNNDSYNATCCFADLTNDCIAQYNYTESEIHRRFHTNCSGYTECVNPFPAVWAKTPTSCSTTTYKNLTNYMYMEYACIEKSRIKKIPSQGRINFRGDGHPVYLQSKSYPEPINDGEYDLYCNISTDLATPIQFYTLDIRLESVGDISTCRQNLTVGNQIYDCTYEDYFNITKQTIANGTTLTFSSLSNVSEGQFFLGFEGGRIHINCVNLVYRPFTLPNTGSSTSNGSTRSSTVAIAAGIAGGLLLIIIIIVAYLCQRRCCRRGKRVGHHNID